MDCIARSTPFRGRRSRRRLQMRARGAAARTRRLCDSARYRARPLARTGERNRPRTFEMMAMPAGHSLAAAAAAWLLPRDAVPHAVPRLPQARTASGVFAPTPIPAASGDAEQRSKCLNLAFKHAGLDGELVAQVRTRGVGAAARDCVAVYETATVAAGDNTNGNGGGKPPPRVILPMTLALHSLLSARAAAQGRARTRARAAALPARARSVHTATRPPRARRTNRAVRPRAAARARRVRGGVLPSAPAHAGRGRAR